MWFDPAEVTQALNLWIDTRQRLKDDGKCCFREHTDLSGKCLPDDFVCESELKWRRYVRLRDNNPEFPWIIVNCLGPWTYKR